MVDQINNNILETRIKATTDIGKTVYFLKRNLIENEYVIPKIIINSAGMSILRMIEILEQFTKEVSN